jgi:hypothetical protein
VNVALYYYAQQSAGGRPKGKKVGAKKVKREAMKQGLRMPE